MTALILAFVCQWGATQSLRAYVSKAEEAYEVRNYSSALAYYEIVLDEESDRLDALYYGGLSAHNLRSYKVAEEYFERIPEAERKEEYKMTNYWLATVKKSLEKFDEAIELFDTYANTPGGSLKSQRRARTEIQNCEWAKKAMAQPVKVEVYQLPETVNSYYSDYGPFIVGDTIYYTSTSKTRIELGKKKKKKKKKRKKRAKKKNKHVEYKLVTKVFRSINGEEGRPIRQNSRAANTFTANFAMNAEGNRMYYSICEQLNQGQDFRCDLYYRERMPGRDWGRANKIQEPVNLPGSSSTQPAVGWDSETGQELLFFVSDRAGGKGNMDIWVSKVSSTGRISSPENLKEVNSDADELTPFFDPHNQTLYFSSDGRQNLGGYDIFRTIKGEKGWGEIENMGYPVNTSFDDLYYIVDPLTSTAYIASNRAGSLCISPDRDCNLHDIYQLTHHLSLSVSAFNEIDFSMLYGATVHIKDLNKGITEEYIMGNDEYKIDLPLFPSREYKIEISKGGYHPGYLEVNTNDLLDEGEPKKYVFLRPSSELVLRTFSAQTRKPIQDLQVEVRDMKDNISQKYTISSGEFMVRIPIQTDREYEIIGLKEGYDDNPHVLSFKGYESQKVLTRDLFLDIEGTNANTEALSKVNTPTKQESKVAVQNNRPAVQPKKATPVPPPATSKKAVPVPQQPKMAVNEIEEDIFPITLYFDNGAPHYKMHPNTSYGATFERYLKKKPRFEAGYASGLTGKERENAKLEASQFFEEEIKSGYYALVDLSDYLLTLLEGGEKVRLAVEGYTSPLANAKYNEALARRRIKTVINHFKYYKSGAFKPYLGNGKLIINATPYGEEKAATDISDNKSDVRSSIYSPKASKERRVVVTGVRVKNKNEDTSDASTSLNE